MAHLKSRSDSLNQSLDNWLKDHLPLWLYKQVTFQPDRAWKPRNYKAAIAFDLFLIAVAVILLVIRIATHFQ